MRLPKKPAAARSLVASMIGSESLPALVEQLSPAALSRLVADIGIEDAGALVTHASENQLTHLLDATIWSGAKPGDPESLSVETLLRWLAVWNDHQIAADKLYELGEDFCAVAFSRLVVISDIDLAARVDDEFTQAIGEYVVRSRIDDEWDVIHVSLLSLWEDFPDFAEAVFARLAFRHTILGMFGEDDTARVLNADASHEHERRREAEGYVTSVMAGAFLQQVAAADLDTLAVETAYDLQTSEYFRRREVETRTEEQRRYEKQARKSSRSHIDEPDEDRELDELEAELEAFERQQSPGPALLTGPDATRSRQAVRLALAALSDQGLVQARMDELAYLSNLLMAGTARDGERIPEKQAAEIAMATCNLGGSYLLWVEFGDDDDTSAFTRLLDGEPGMVRLFRIGWHLLARIPFQVLGRLQRLMADPETRAGLAARPMVRDEVDALLAEEELPAQVRRGDFDDARETLRLLTILLEPRAVVGLCALMDATPALSDALEAESHAWDERISKVRNLDSMADLMLVDGFLKSLSEQFRGGD